MSCTFENRICAVLGACTYLYDSEAFSYKDVDTIIEGEEPLCS